ncbi:MAG: universal stress protein [Nannocystaceae bacterium]
MTNSGVFLRVLVPVELQPSDAPPAGDRGVKVGDGEWLSVSESTVEALQLAARLARGGEVYLVHTTPEFVDFPTWLSPKGLAELDDDAREDALSVLVGTAERFCQGVTLHPVIRPGKPLDVTLAAAQQYDVEAIVLAASSRHRVNRALLGSTADKLIRQAVCPVVVVPSGPA